MKNIYVAITLAVSMFLIACEDFLDNDPSTSLPSDEAIKTVQDLKIAVNGIYFMQIGQMPLNVDRFMGARGSYAGDFTLMADLMGEDAYSVGNYNQVSELGRYQYTKNSDLVRHLYRRFYYTLARVNKVMELTRASGLEGEDVNILMGELHAFRGLLHFDLARMFAKLPSIGEPDDLGIVLSQKTYPGDYVGERSTIKETYEYIVADLDTAIKLLPETAGISGTGHMNYWAARAVRARAYLYMEENSLALEDAQYVIQNSPYTLYTIDNYLDVWGKEGTSESIFELLVTSQHNSQRNSLGFYTHAEGYAECAVAEAFVEFMENKAQEGDIRKKLVAYEEDEGYHQAYYTQKYPGRGGELYVNNPKIIRLSEVYLIAAEAALKAGKDSPQEYINKIRSNRIAGYAPVNSVTLEDILLERRLELFAEGHQAWDAWRNKLPVNNPVKGIVNYDNTLTILPIPVSEINMSKGKLHQNPGY